MSWGPSLAWTQKPHQRRPLGPPRKGIGETRPSGCARKRSSRRSFPLDTADFVRDVLLKYSAEGFIEMIREIKYFIASLSFVIMLIAAGAGTAFAQGSRKDDIVFNAQGRPMPGAAVRVCTSTATGQPCTPLAQVYSDAALTQALANPLSADGMGNYSFYAAPGRYMIELSGPGIITKQIPNVILPSDPNSPTFANLNNILYVGAATG